MPSCEMCGKESKLCKAAKIENVKMMLCPDCIRHGEGIQQPAVVQVPPKVERFMVQRARKAQPKDIYKGMEKELIRDWPRVIQQAREKKGLTREELGFHIGERMVTIAKLEKGDLRPSDKMIEKLEKELGISLLEEVQGAPPQGIRSQTGKLTLGDFVKTEDT